MTQDEALKEPRTSKAIIYAAGAAMCAKCQRIPTNHTDSCISLLAPDLAQHKCTGCGTTWHVIDSFLANGVHTMRPATPEKV